VQINASDLSVGGVLWQFLLFAAEPYEVIAFKVCTTLIYRQAVPFGTLHRRVSGGLDVWGFGCLGVWMFGCLGVWVSGCCGSPADVNGHR
jgi:hypothetical protein